jgi:hypothetical protein
MIAIGVDTHKDRHHAVALDQVGRQLGELVPVADAAGFSTPRRRGVLSAIRALLVARRSAVGERTRILNQLQALNVTAPIALRERVGRGTGRQIERRILSMRARPGVDLEERVAFAVMRDLAAHSRALGADARRYEHKLAELVAEVDPTLLRKPGVGQISAAKLLACDPARFRSEAAFARCNGTAPIPASSGKTVRHRLNRGGDRQVNNAIHTIAIARAKYQPETRAYLDRRIHEGKSKREALRSLKRHISRELYRHLTAVPLTS